VTGGVGEAAEVRQGEGGIGEAEGGQAVGNPGLGDGRVQEVGLGESGGAIQ